MSTVNSNWESFAQQLPPEVREGTKELFRRTYFAGATSVFLMFVSVADGSLTQEEAVKAMAATGDELEAFREEMFALLLDHLNIDTSAGH